MSWLDGPLVLSLEPDPMVLLAISVIVAVLTVVQGRAKTLQGLVHLVLLAALLFVSLQRCGALTRAARRRTARRCPRARSNF